MLKKAKNRLLPRLVTEPRPRGSRSRLTNDHEATEVRAAAALHYRSARRNVDRARHLGVPATQDRSLPRYLRHAGGRHHALSGPRGGGGGATGHGSDRARTEQRPQRHRPSLAHHLRAFGRRADLRLRRPTTTSLARWCSRGCAMRSFPTASRRRWARCRRPSASCTATRSKATASIPCGCAKSRTGWSRRASFRSPAWPM